MPTLDEILKEIAQAKSIIILVHENPDGDAIGSGLAMYQALQNMGKDVEIVVPEWSRIFANLPKINELKKEGSKKKYDLAIALDCATIKMLNGWTNYFEDAKNKVVIDHHSSNSMFGDFNYVDIDAPACCQVLYNMFEYYNWQITKEIAACLIAGLITDTGGFQYSGVSKDTFLMAANLIDTGIDAAKIYKDVMSTHTKTSVELKKLILNRMQFLEDDKVTFTYMTLEDEKEIGCEVGDYEGLVNEGRNIEGVEVSIFLHEIDDGFKASLRSNNYVNVSDVCLMFGGGGHIRAAGAKIKGTPEEIKEKLLKEIKRQLK